jgi:hypothetical protein
VALQSGGEDLHDGFEGDGAGFLVEGGALGGSDELRGSIPVWADPSGPFAEQTDRAGSTRNRVQLMNAKALHVEAVPRHASVEELTLSRDYPQRNCRGHNQA